MDLYAVFIRRWYQDGPRDRYTGRKALVPHIGRKTFLARNVTRERALRMCEEYNNSHRPGRYSLKAEFTSEGNL